MVDNRDQILHFNEYFKIIRNRLWVIFTIFCLTVLSGFYVTEEVITKQYTATAQIQLNPERLSLTGIGPDNPQNSDPASFQAELLIMQSSDVLLPIITDLGYDKIWAKRMKAGDALSPQDAVGYLNGRLRVDFNHGTNIATISVTGEIPKECSDLANAVADRYKTLRDVEVDQRINRGIDALRDQIAQQQQVVDKRKADVETMRADLGKKGIVIPNGVGLTPNIHSEQDLSTLKQTLLSAQEDFDARSVLLQSVVDLPDDQFLSTLAGLNRGEPDIETLHQNILSQQSDKQNLLKDGFDENHPRILALNAQIAAEQSQMTEAIAGLRRAMKVDTDMAKSRVTLLQQQVDALSSKVLDETQNALVPFREKEREVDQQQSILDALTVRLKQVVADSVLQLSPVRIISRADPPEAPTKPNKGLNMLVSVFAGLFVGVSVAFLIEYLDTSVKTMADAETLLGLPVLTVIPNKGGPMPLIQDSGRLPHAEGYRILRAKLDLKVQNGIGPCLTMLSGGPGEGKSTTIYNLAIVCAQAGQSVILVDCDLRRPTLHELLGVTNERGLSNYLRGEGEAVRFIQRTAIPKLQCLAAGNMPISEIGVLAGDKIRIMLDDLKQRYDLVLIDAPPVLGISDGSIIAREVDYVILVIQHRRYPREISLRAKRAIEEVHGNCVGMVLNCVAVKSDDSYYYYSNYGNYYKKPKKKRKDSVAANGKPAPAAARKTVLDSEEF